MKHTQGKWELTGVHKLEVVTQHEFNGKHEWERIALVEDFDHKKENMPHSEKVANAKLIAAAPELLEALQGLLNQRYEDLRHAHDSSKNKWLRDHRNFTDYWNTIEKIKNHEIAKQVVSGYGHSDFEHIRFAEQAIKKATE